MWYFIKGSWIIMVKELEIEFCNLLIKEEYDILIESFWVKEEDFFE